MHWSSHLSVQQSSSLNQTADSVPGSQLRQVPQSKASKPTATAPASWHTQAEQFSLEQLIKGGNRLPVALEKSRAPLPKATNGTSKPASVLDEQKYIQQEEPVSQAAPC